MTGRKSGPLYVLQYSLGGNLTKHHQILLRIRPNFRRNQVQESSRRSCLNIKIFLHKSGMGIRTSNLQTVPMVPFMQGYTVWHCSKFKDVAIMCRNQNGGEGASFSSCPSLTIRIFAYFSFSGKGELILAAVKNLSAVSLISVNSFSAVSLTPARNFKGFLVISDRYLRHREKCYGLKSLWRSHGPLNRVCEVSMDAPFHGGYNDTINGRRYHYLLTAASLFLPRSSQFCRDNRPVGIIVTGDKLITQCQ